MSTYHASFDDFAPLEPTSSRTAWGAIASLREAASSIVVGLVAQFHAHRMQRGMARYSDHLLRDVGFGRDSDGTIVPLPSEPDASE